MRAALSIAVAVLSLSALAQEASVDGGVAPAMAEGQGVDAGLPVPVEAVTTVEPATPAVEAAPFAKIVEVNGYADSRTSFTRSRTWGLVPTDDQPQLQELLELNAQLKVSIRPRTSVSADLSLVGNFGGFYRGLDDTGRETKLDDHVSAQVQPVVSINELYFAHEFRPEFNVLIGKKRIVWGPGLAYNPTDFLNARRDPTDPTFQRSGVWLAQAEVPLTNFTFSLVFAPTQLKSVAGIPTHLMFWPTYDQRDDQAHYQLAARAYALLWDSDVNLMLFYGNKANDDFEQKLRAGASFSRVFFTDYEFHIEALFQTGSARDIITSECVESQLAALLCSQLKTAVITKPKLTDSTLNPRVLVGARRNFSDDSMLSIEYLFQADGWSPAQFQDFANGLDLIRQGRASGLPVNRIPGASQLIGGQTVDGLPTRFNFDPRARHYAFITFQKPRIADDFTAQLVLIANLQDLSSLWTPSVSWSATEWMTLSLFAFVPVQGLNSLSAKTTAGTYVSEYGATPFAFRTMFEARIFY